MAGPGRPKKIQENVAPETNAVYVEQERVFFGEQSNLQGVSVISPGMGYTSEPDGYNILPANRDIPVMEEPFFESIDNLDSVLEGANSKARHAWESIASAPRNGFPIKLTDDISNPGTVAFWRKSRAFANATHRWEETGFWTDSATGKNIDFTPTHWKDRHAV